jgi:hypothetical protein
MIGERVDPIASEHLASPLKDHLSSDANRPPSRLGPIRAERAWGPYLESPRTGGLEVSEAVEDLSTPHEQSAEHRGHHGRGPIDSKPRGDSSPVSYPSR